METINKRWTLTKSFSFLALGFLFISTIFKVLHLQFAGEVLLLSFACLTVSLLVTSLNGILLNKGKSGAMRVLAVIVGIITLLIGFSFRIFHISGADPIVALSVGILIVSMLVNTTFVYQNASGEGNLLTFLLEKYTPGIERFFLLLLLPLAVYKTILIFSDNNVFAGDMILLIVILGAGLYLIALTWRFMETDLSKRNSVTLTLTVISCLCLILPFLGSSLQLELRICLIILYSLVSGWLACRMEDEPGKTVSMVLAVLVPILFLGWGLIELKIIPYSLHSIFFNIPILILLVTGLFICRKHSTMRAYMLVSLSGYLFEYIS